MRAKAIFFSRLQSGIDVPASSALCCSGVGGVDGLKMGISETCRTHCYRLGVVDASGSRKLHNSRYLNPVFRSIDPQHPYIEAAGLRGDRQGPLFPLRDRQDRRPYGQAHVPHGCLVHVRRRAADAGFETAIGCHTFRATGITDYLTNGGRIEVAQHMAGHSNARTTGLYDRRHDDISVGEVERIGI
jgi:hypothetical protein